MFAQKPKLPRVTLLIPCFNSTAFVGDAIRCALAQTYGHVEIIVAPDDGKAYQELRSKFTSPQLRIIAPGSSAGTGAGATRNRAIDASSGDFFTMLDADDTIPPTYIEDLMKVASVEGAAIVNTRYARWNDDIALRIPPVHHKHLSLSGFAQLLASMHPLVHRSMEPGYCGGFAEDVIHDGIIIAKLETITLVDTVLYGGRVREGSLCNGAENDAEAAIQEAYRQRIDQVLYRPTEIGVHVLPYRERDDFADLFRFRGFASKRFSQSGEACYNTWVAGKEAALWDAYTQAKRDMLPTVGF